MAIIIDIGLLKLDFVASPRLNVGCIPSLLCLCITLYLAGGVPQDFLDRQMNLEQNCLPSVSNFGFLLALRVKDNKSWARCSFQS